MAPSLEGWSRPFVWRTRKLVEQQVVRRAKEIRRGGRHVNGLDAGGGEGQMIARLKEDGVEQLLQLWHLKAVDPIVGGEEGDDEEEL